MKEIKCEVCGGTDIVKQDGVYVCQNCGMRYSLEDVRSVYSDVIVRIDKNEEKANQIKLLNFEFQSLKKRNGYRMEKKIEIVENIANKILEIDADDAVAWFTKRLIMNVLRFPDTLYISQINQEEYKLIQNYTFENISEIKNTIIFGRLIYILLIGSKSEIYYEKIEEELKSIFELNTLEFLNILIETITFIKDEEQPIILTEGMFDIVKVLKVFNKNVEKLRFTGVDFQLKYSKWTKVLEIIR